MSIKKITSPSLSPLDHGFFTRDGGVSKGVYAGLNCGIGSLDDRAAVYENKARVAEDFGLQPEALIGVHQIHSATAVVVAQKTDQRQMHLLPPYRGWGSRYLAPIANLCFLLIISPE